MEWKLLVKNLSILIFICISIVISRNVLQDSQPIIKNIKLHVPNLHSPLEPLIMSNIEKVHIIFMNHLDVGYDGVSPDIGFVNVILNRYFTDYFPRAINLHRQLTKGGYTETFKYTTHPWLVSLYIDCPPNLVLANIKLKCPNATELGEFTAAVKAGIITWHAGPMNMQPEFMDEWMFAFGLSLSSSLDARFGIKRAFRVLSQRDVPGFTKAALPSLVRVAIGGVSVGVNMMSAPPGVPKVFRWRHQDAEVIATWHPGGYPNSPGGTPASPGGLSVKDCATVTGHPEAMCFAFRTDNFGPPVSVQEVLDYYEILRKEFPNAKLVASTMENFMVGLKPISDQLPVITEEIGDTWIMGISSDPRKVAEYRAISRTFRDCFSAGACRHDDIRVWNASRFLLKIPEHTWGLPSNYDTVNWTNAAFREAKSGFRYKNCIKAWLEQRAFLNLAISALADHPVATEVKRRISKTRPQEPDLSDFHPLSLPSVVCQSATLKMGLSQEGAIDQLVYNKTEWAGTSSLLGKFLYVTYNASDFERFSSVYDYDTKYSAGFVKTNLTRNASPISRIWPSRLTALYQRNTRSCDLWAHVQLVDKAPIMHYGAPLDVWIRYTERPASSPGVDIDLNWFDKTATRIPEAIMFSFEPKIGASKRFLLSKMNQLIDPMNGILNGSNFLHGLDDNGFYYMDSKTSSGLQISSPDVALVSLITHDHGPTSYAIPLSPIQTPLLGAAFNMFNNVWDTNYVLWYPYVKGDQNYRARFSISFVDGVKKAKRWGS